MPSYQLKELIELLDVEDMQVGLQFFTEDKLLDLLKDVPKEELVKVVFEMFSPDLVIEYMPDDQLNKLLTSEKMDKGLVLKNLQALPAMYLAQIIESVTGEETQGTQFELTQQIANFGQEQYNAALRNLMPEQKRELTLAIATQHPKVFELFDASAYTKIIGRERNKEDMIKAMGVIKPEHLRKMMEKLPHDLLSLVLTQIDNNKFADMLINKHPELLAKFIASVNFTYTQFILYKLHTFHLLLARNQKEEWFVILESTYIQQLQNPEMNQKIMQN